MKSDDAPIAVRVSAEREIKFAEIGEVVHQPINSKPTFVGSRAAEGLVGPGPSEYRILVQPESLRLILKNGENVPVDEGYLDAAIESLRAVGLMNDAVQRLAESIRAEIVDRKGEYVEPVETFSGLRAALWPGDPRDMILIMRDFAAGHGLKVDVIERDHRDQFRFTN
jgi:hypothetical protein